MDICRCVRIFFILKEGVVLRILKSNIFRMGIVITLIFLSTGILHADDDYNNEVYAPFFIGSWNSNNFEGESLMFKLVKSILIEFGNDGDFNVRAKLPLGFHKEYTGHYKISSSKIYLYFENGAQEIMKYEPIDDNIITVEQPERVSANFVRRSGYYETHLPAA